MPRKKRTAPGDNTAPAFVVIQAPESLPEISLHYVIVPPPVEQAPPADGHAATGGERHTGSIAHYEECPYCLLATPHTLTQHTAAIMRQPGARPQR